MSETPPAGSLANGPESRHVVDAVDAVLRGDVASARSALITCAAEVGWEAIGHRLDVAGRALTLDAGYTPATIPLEIDLVPEVLESTLDVLHEQAPRVVARWQHPEGPGPVDLDEVWPALVLVAWLVDEAGFPAEVVV